jgi:hypothetical protein
VSQLYQDLEIDLLPAGFDRRDPFGRDADLGRKRDSTDASLLALVADGVAER